MIQLQDHVLPTSINSTEFSEQSGARWTQESSFEGQVFLMSCTALIVGLLHFHNVRPRWRRTLSSVCGTIVQHTSRVHIKSNPGDEECNHARHENHAGIYVRDWALSLIPLLGISVASQRAHCRSMLTAFEAESLVRTGQRSRDSGFCQVERTRGGSMARLLRKLEAPSRSVLRRSLFGGRRGLVTDAGVHGTGFLTERVWDAVVVGGGHNGLTAAAYLARAGLQVAVLERRHVLGGAAVTEEIVPGFKFSRASYLQSLLRPGIIQELDLARHGLKLLPRNPSSFTPTVDGRFLLMGPDPKLNEAEISKFSKNDAVAYPKYEHMLEKFCTVMDPLLDTVPPEAAVGESSLAGRVADGWSKSKVLGSLLKRSSKLKQHEITSFVELLLAPASKVLNNWFESDVLKATLATDAVIGAMASVHTSGSGYVLLHHVMGETNGSRGIWSYVEGGMGAVSTTIARAASEAGATLATNVEAKQFLVDNESSVEKAITGVVLADGTEIRAKKILSNATPAVTFLKLMPENVLSEEFRSGVKSIDYKSGTTKINIAVDRLPIFRACARTDNTPGPEHYGTIHLGTECMDEIDIAFREALLGRASSRPLIEMTIPSVLDPTIAPPGEHVINLFIQYTPYDLKTGGWQDQATRDSFAKTCFDLIDEYAPGFSSSIVGYDMLTPPDLERVLGLTGGNIFHGAMGLDALFLLRPLKGWSGYRTPVKGLYMCGAGAHPGGGVMGAPGRNAASVVLKDLLRA